MMIIITATNEGAAGRFDESQFHRSESVRCVRRHLFRTQSHARERSAEHHPAWCVQYAGAAANSLRRQTVRPYRQFHDADAGSAKLDRSGSAGIAAAAIKHRSV